MHFPRAVMCTRIEWTEFALLCSSVLSLFFFTALICVCNLKLPEDKQRKRKSERYQYMCLKPCDIYHTCPHVTDSFPVDRWLFMQHPGGMFFSFNCVCDVDAGSSWYCVTDSRPYKTVATAWSGDFHSICVHTHMKMRNTLVVHDRPIRRIRDLLMSVDSQRQQDGEQTKCLECLERSASVCQTHFHRLGFPQCDSIKKSKKWRNLFSFSVSLFPLVLPYFLFQRFSLRLKLFCDAVACSLNHELRIPQCGSVHSERWSSWGQAPTAVQTPHRPRVCDRWRQRRFRRTWWSGSSQSKVHVGLEQCEIRLVLTHVNG